MGQEAVMDTPIADIRFEDALRHLASSIPSRMAEFQGAAVRWLTEDWARSEDGQWRRDLTEKVRWSPSAVTAIEELDEYAGLEAVTSRDPVLAPQIGQLVGCITGAFRVDLSDIVQAVIPAPGALFDEAVFAASYRQVSTLLYGESIDFERVVLLEGIAPEEPVVLRPDLHLTRITEEQTRQCLRVGVLIPLGNMPLYVPAEGGDWALVRRFSWPKTVHSAIREDFATEEQSRVVTRDDTATLLGCLAIVGAKGVRASGSIQRQVTWSGFGQGVQFAPMQTASFPREATFRLGRSLAAELQRIWVISDSEHFMSNHAYGALRLALRRLSTAAHRDDLADSIIDLFVAGEAFYLTDVGNEASRGELRYRLALRGAYWADANDRRRVFDTLRKGYDLRSKVVHGSDLNSAKDPQNAQSIVDDVEEILRVALRKALSTIEVSGQFPVPWDALVLDLKQ